jgi:AraC-like DNA-binding protein
MKPTVEIYDGMKKERFYRGQSQFPRFRFQFQFLNFHKLSMSDSYEYPLHRHSNYELILVENGPYRCSLNAQEISVDSLQILLIQPDDLHQDHLKPHQKHYVVHFDILSNPGSQPIRRILRKGCKASHQIAKMASAEDFSLLDEIAAESVGLFYSGNIQDSLLEVLSWRVLRRFPQGILDGGFLQHTSTNQFIERIFASISSSISERIQVSDLAADLDMPERTLNEKCRLLLKISPSELIRKVKIEESKRLLRIGNPSIKEVAYRLGFSSPFHFSQVFKQETGQSPKHWREC